MSWPCCCLYLTPHPFTDSFQFIHSLKIVVSRRNFLVWNILEKGLSLPKESWKMHDLFFSDHFQSDWGLWFKNAFYFLRGKMTVTDKIGCLQGICHQFSGISDHQSAAELTELQLSRDFLAFNNIWRNQVTILIS